MKSSFIKTFNKNKPYIALTAPHAHCLDVNYRTCDLKAKIAIIYISEILTKLKLNFINHINVTLRGKRENDMNRFQSRSTEYRKKLSKYIKDFDVIFNLDIHSYWQNDKHIFYIIDGTGYPCLYCVDFIKSMSNGLNLEFTDDIIKYGPHSCSKRFKTFKEAYDKCDYTNDIQDEFREQGIDSILIEFKESLSKKKIKEICKHVCYWIYKKYSGNDVTIDIYKKIFGDKNYKKYFKLYSS